jgi:ATP-dependent DNA ligase
LKVLSCQLEPPSKGIELNLADNTLIQTLGKVYGVPEEKIKEEYKKIGDLAKISSTYQAIRENSQELDITEFIDTLKQMATIKGKGARDQKELMLEQMLKKLKTQNEIFYVVRFLQVLYLIFLPLRKT